MPSQPVAEQICETGSLRCSPGWLRTSATRSLRRVAARLGGAGLNMAAGLEFVLSIGDDNFTGRQAAGDDREITLRDRNSHWPHVNGVVGLRQENVGSLGTTLDRSRGHHGGVLA